MAIKLKKTKAGTLDIRGVSIPVFVEQLRGSVVFTAELGGDGFHHESVDGLIKVLMSKSRRVVVRFNVPFLREKLPSVYKESGVMRGTVYAVHGATERGMVRWADGTKEQMDLYSRYDHKGFLDPEMTMEEQKSLVYLHKESRAAANKYEEYREGFSIDLRNLVSEAHEKAVKELMEGEES